jgi:hypothetical protein
MRTSTLVSLPGVLLAAAFLAAPARAQWLVDQAAAFDRFGSAVAVGDFDDDGFDDLAVGIPGEDHSGVYGAGAVRVYYGGGSGFGSGGEDYLAAGVGGMPLAVGSYDAFGESLAVGDFDADGVDDLAIGAPGAKVGPDDYAGAVVVLPGHLGWGVLAWDATVFHQDSAGVQGMAEPYDRFGRVLCAADFDGDGACDLAVGVPYEDIGSTKVNAGAVNVLFGSHEIGLSGAGDQLWHADVGGVAEVSQSFDYFGSALAAGDFDGNGLPDLAIGIPGSDNSTSSGEIAYDAGMVHVLRSWELQGPTTVGQDFVFPVSPFHPGAIFAQESAFGTALAVGDYDLDGLDDLAVGSPYAATDLLGVVVPDAGVVQVYFGGPFLSVDDSVRLHQNTPGIGGTAEPNDRFGATLATGSFDFTGLDALVIGAPGEAIGSLGSAGAIHVLYPSPQGPKASGSQIWYQNVGGIEGTSGSYDQFGAALASGDVTGDGIDDLVIGIPGETVESYASAGAVGVLRGTAEDAVVATGDLLIHEFAWSDPPIYW